MNQKLSPRISSSGTGFVCGIDLIATNYHFIQNGSKWEITFPTSGRTYQLQLVTADKTNDLAVLRIIHRRSGETGKPKPLRSQLSLQRGSARNSTPLVSPWVIFWEAATKLQPVC